MDRSTHKLARSIFLSKILVSLMCLVLFFLFSLAVLSLLFSLSLGFSLELVEQ
jgi:hypothetical protein